jgi:hypothetical protein
LHAYQFLTYHVDSERMSHARRRSHTRHAPRYSRHHGEESFRHSAVCRSSFTTIWRTGVVCNCGSARLWHPHLDPRFVAGAGGGLFCLCWLLLAPSSGALHCAGSISRRELFIFRGTKRRATADCLFGALRRSHGGTIRFICTVAGALGSDHAVRYPCRAGHPRLYDGFRRHLRLDLSAFRPLDGDLLADLGLRFRITWLCTRATVGSRRAKHTSF